MTFNANTEIQKVSLEKYRQNDKATLASPSIPDSILMFISTFKVLQKLLEKLTGEKFSVPEVTQSEEGQRNKLK